MCTRYEYKQSLPPRSCRPCPQDRSPPYWEASYNLSLLFLEDTYIQSCKTTPPPVTIPGTFSGSPIRAPHPIISRSSQLRRGAVITGEIQVPSSLLANSVSTSSTIAVGARRKATQAAPINSCSGDSSNFVVLAFTSVRGDAKQATCSTTSQSLNHLWIEFAEAI